MVRSGGVRGGKTASWREATPGSLASARLLPAPRGRARLVATVAGWGPTRVAAVMLILGLVLRALGAYSDITQLYFRDALWRHPFPYVDYPLEYPVLLGAVVWLVGAFHHVVPYFCATAALLIGAGLLTVWLGGRFAGANLWVFALAPALPLYVVLNWDMLGVALTVGALLALRRDRDGLAGLLLAAAVWTKFFPLVILPLAVWDRLLRRRPRDAARLLVTFGLVSVAVNAPVALVHGPDGWALRAGWLHFFRFNRDRPLELNAWNLLARWEPTTAQINVASALLLALGLVALALLLAVVRRRAGAPAGDLLLPAALAALGWWFLVNKVYSPQYSLWLIALLALAGAPTRLGAAFAVIDLGYYAASFIALAHPAATWWYANILFPAMVIREVVILVIVLWGARRLYLGVSGSDTPTEHCRPRGDPGGRRTWNPQTPVSQPGIVPAPTIEAIASHSHGRPFGESGLSQQDQVLLTLHDCNPPEEEELLVVATGRPLLASAGPGRDRRLYVHPYAWDEIGFGGPRYPRGYMHLEGARRNPGRWQN